MIQQISNNPFNITEAIMVIMTRNKTISNLVTLKKYKIAVNIATTAWNFALIEHISTSKSLKIQLIRTFSTQLNINLKQTNALLDDLIQLKSKFYSQISHPIFHYTIELGNNNNPILRIVASNEFSVEVIIDKIKTGLYPEKYAVHKAFRVESPSIN